MIRWEYATLALENNLADMPNHLNKVGADGWEAFAIYTQPNATIFFLKRIKKDA